MAFALAPQPKSLLGRHRLLSPTAGVKVSPLCLGAMNFGDSWKEFMGECSKETAFEMLDFFHSQGGNFIDTANNYQSEESEMWIGEWMKTRGVRDQMVVATKFTTGWLAYKGHDNIINSNFGGNNSKSLMLSVRDSLKKLQTDYIDVLYVHWWDFTTSIPELMQSLNQLVATGKVLYLGISDTPAWIVSKANEYARNHGLRQFVVYQGRWSAARRDFERDIIPMCKAEGMGLAPWGALGGGNFKTEEERKKSEGRKMRGPSDNEIKISEVLEKIAKEKGTVITSVALAYVMQKTPYVCPIVGGRKVDHLKGNIEALSLVLSGKDYEEIEAATDFDVGFPLNFLSNKPGGAQGPADVWLANITGHFDFVEDQKPITPAKSDA
ncbi:MAG: norsolorinic acid reductase [Lasallia pustulata]|uniref:Norsolorinic acid reductase n=1 Tax=Lasallia pustulata TaxID=136370 RepID=A0A5M8PEE9_9LECA|nr:MAG: norsolorinic acid reductase [Lasallia pustulata]